MDERTFLVHSLAGSGHPTFSHQSTTGRLFTSRVSGFSRGPWSTEEEEKKQFRDFLLISIAIVGIVNAWLATHTELMPCWVSI